MFSSDDFLSSASFSSFSLDIQLNKNKIIEMS